MKDVFLFPSNYLCGLIFSCLLYLPSASAKESDIDQSPRQRIIIPSLSLSHHIGENNRDLSPHYAHRLLPSPTNENNDKQNFNMYLETKNDNYLWISFQHGYPDAIDIMVNIKLCSDNKNKIYTILESQALRCNRQSQEILMHAFLTKNKDLIPIDITNQKQFSFLKEIARKNKYYQTLLIEIYMNGGFGIKFKQKKIKREGRQLAENYGISNHDVQNLIVEAMKHNKLGYKSKRSYAKKQYTESKKNNKKNSLTRELDLLREYAMKGNSKAAKFLLECFMEQKYGADPLNSRLFIKIVDSFIELADSDRELQDMILIIYQNNIFHMTNKKRLNDELYVLKMRYDYTDYGEILRNLDALLYSDLPTFNPYECLADVNSMYDSESEEI